MTFRKSAIEITNLKCNIFIMVKHWKFNVKVKRRKKIFHLLLLLTLLFHRRKKPSFAFSFILGKWFTLQHIFFLRIVCFEYMRQNVDNENNHLNCTFCFHFPQIHIVTLLCSLFFIFERKKKQNLWPNKNIISYLIVLLDKCNESQTINLNAFIPNNCHAHTHTLQLFNH